LPALLTIQSGINQLRYATLKGIMAAKKKEIRKVVPSGAIAARQRIAALYLPERKKQTEMLTGTAVEAASELVRRLRDEARALSLTPRRPWAVGGGLWAWAVGRGLLAVAGGRWPRVASVRAG